MHASMLRALVSLALAGAPAVVGACNIVGAGTREWFETKQRTPLGRRASFDLSCPQRDLQFRPLGDYSEGAYADGDYTTVGVSGCGKKATYVRANGDWVMNNASNPAGDVSVSGAAAGAGTGASPAAAPAATQ